MYNILLVDDSNVVKAVLYKLLSRSSLPIRQIYDADNGAQALEVLDTHEMDLVVADINMPVMDGVELVERIRDDSRLCHIPIVMISTEGSQTRIARLKELGINAYVRKPFSPEEIAAVFCEVLGVSHA